MKTPIKLLLKILLLLCISLPLLAQENDHVKLLKDAEKAYEEGKFQQCVDLLEKDVESIPSKDRFEAYRLLSICYLNLHDEAKANEAAVSLLKSKPEYKEFPYADPLEFSRLLNQYEVRPTLELGLVAGFNTCGVRSISDYTATGTPATFKPGFGFQAGITAEYFFLRNLSATAQFLYQGVAYSRESDIGNGWHQTFSERLNYFSIPLSARYYFFKKGAFTFGCELGVQTDFLNRTHSQIVMENADLGENIQSTMQQVDQRTKTLYYVFPGLLAKYKIGGGQLAAGIRYAYGLRNAVIADNRYDNAEFIMANRYVDGDFSFNLFSFSLSYQLPIPSMYRVQKIN